MKSVWGIVYPLAVGTAGGAIFYLLGMPLPWTLGSLTAVALLAVLGPPFAIPPALIHVARPVVGVLAGSAFTPAILASVFGWWDAFLYVIAFSFAMTALGYFYFRTIGKIDRPTAFFASMPGGLGELSLLGDQFGGNVRNLVLIHSIRVVAVVFSFPLAVQFLFGAVAVPMAARVAELGTPGALDWVILAACAIGGYIAARYLKFPGGAVVAAMLLSALAHGFELTHATPPAFVVAAVQIIIGSIAGSRFVGIKWREFGRLIALAAVWTAVLLFLAVLAALLGAQLFDRSLETMLLSLAPGGIVEMTVVAYAFGFETAFVIACQVCRVFAVLTFAPLLGTAIFGRAKPPKAKPTESDEEPD